MFLLPEVAMQIYFPKITVYVYFTVRYILKINVQKTLLRKKKHGSSQSNIRHIIDTDRNITNII